MFQELEGQTAIVVSKGVYKQAPVYMRDDGSLFAKVGSGFIRLNGTGSTSHAGTRIDFLACDIPLFVNQFGHLFAKGGAKYKALTPAQSEILKLEKD